MLSAHYYKSHVLSNGEYKNYHMNLKWFIPNFAWKYSTVSCNRLLIFFWKEKFIRPSKNFSPTQHLSATVVTGIRVKYSEKKFCQSNGNSGWSTGVSSACCAHLYRERYPEVNVGTLTMLQAFYKRKQNEPKFHYVYSVAYKLLTLRAWSTFTFPFCRSSCTRSSFHSPVRFSLSSCSTDIIKYASHV